MPQPHKLYRLEVRQTYDGPDRCTFAAHFSNLADANVAMGLVSAVLYDLKEQRALVIVEVQAVGSIRSGLLPGRAG